MCEICHQTPCHNCCPNAPEPPVVCLCCQCGNEIYEGDELYSINDEKWCEECVTDCRTTAEMDEPDYDFLSTESELRKYPNTELLEELRTELISVLSMRRNNADSL